MLQALGHRVHGNRFSEWESGAVTPDIHTLSTISLLHPNPAECFKWLNSGDGTMPRIQVDRPVYEGSTPEMRSRVVRAVSILSRAAGDASALLTNEKGDPVDWPE